MHTRTDNPLHIGQEMPDNAVEEAADRPRAAAGTGPLEVEGIWLHF